MIFEIFFVRHGESCANAWQKEFQQGTQWLYQDPELTARGIRRTIDYSKPLLYLINKFWNNNPYSIGASALLRTQLTAYWQLARLREGSLNPQIETSALTTDLELKPENLSRKVNGKPKFGIEGLRNKNLPHGKSISIFPHICEPLTSIDNKPFKKEKQRQIIANQQFVADPALGQHILRLLDEGEDFRNLQSIRNQSSMKDFLKWMWSNSIQFPIGQDGIHRAVVFTHSYFLKKTFPLPTKASIMNNGIIYTRFHSPPIQKKGLYDFPNFAYYDTVPNLMGPYICPDLCRVTLPKCRKTEKNRNLSLTKISDLQDISLLDLQELLEVMSEKKDLSESELKKKQLISKLWRIKSVYEFMLTKGLPATILTAEKYIELKDKSDLLISVTERIKQFKKSLISKNGETVGLYNTIKLNLPILNSMINDTSSAKLLADFNSLANYNTENLNHPNLAKDIQKLEDMLQEISRLKNAEWNFDERAEKILNPDYRSWAQTSLLSPPPPLPSPPPPPPPRPSEQSVARPARNTGAGVGYLRPAENNQARSNRENNNAQTRRNRHIAGLLGYNSGDPKAMPNRQTLKNRAKQLGINLNLPPRGG